MRWAVIVSIAMVRAGHSKYSHSTYSHSTLACLEVGGGILYPVLLAEPKAGVDAVGVVCLVRVRVRGGGEGVVGGVCLVRVRVRGGGRCGRWHVPAQVEVGEDVVRPYLLWP